MNLSKLVDTLLTTLKENAPEILTALGIAGVGVTGYYAAKGGKEYGAIVAQEELMYSQHGVTSFGTVPYGQEDILTPLQKVKLGWPQYSPAIIAGIGTTAAIFFAYKGQTKRTVAAVTAYTLSERAFTEYREKMVEQLSAAKDRKVLDAIAQDRVAANPPPTNGLVVVGRDEALFCELHTMRYFKSDIDTVRKAVNTINHWIVTDRHVRLDDLYNMLKLEPTDTSGHMGWDDDELLDLEFSTQMTPDERPCITFRYNYLKPLK